MATIKYGIAGYSQDAFDKEVAVRLLTNEFKKITERHPSCIIEIVSGYTNTGIPKLAYEVADNFGFTTVGFSAKQALSEDCGLYPVDKVILEGKNYGDESEAFIAYIDHLIRIGGGTQSLKESQMFSQKKIKLNTQSLLIEHEIERNG